jgi:hypothetical protein
MAFKELEKVRQKLKVKGIGKRVQLRYLKKTTLGMQAKHSTRNHDYPSSSNRKDEELGENLRSTKSKRKQSLGGKAETSNSNKPKH